MDRQNNFAKTGQAIANKAADKVQAGTQSMDALSDAASQASDTIITYARENPMKALMIAAASGALLLTLIKILNPSRD